MVNWEAAQERRWRGLPRLRAILEKKQLPDHYFGPTSEFDNVFESIPRVLEVALLACECKSEIGQAAASQDRDAIVEELARLESSLRSARGILDDTARRIENVGRTLRA